MNRPAVEEFLQGQLGRRGPSSTARARRWKYLTWASIARYRGRADVRPLREQAGHALGARVLQAAAVAVHAHRHLGFLGGDAELGEQPQQVRVGAVVVHQERRVEPGDLPVRHGDVVGVRVPTQPVVGLEELHIELPLQQVGRGEAGHPAADHGDGRARGVARCHRAPLAARPRPTMVDGGPVGVAYWSFGAGRRSGLVSDHAESGRWYVMTTGPRLHQITARSRVILRAWRPMPALGRYSIVEPCQQTPRPSSRRPSASIPGAGTASTGTPVRCSTWPPSSPGRPARRRSVTSAPPPGTTPPGSPASTRRWPTGSGPATSSCSPCPMSMTFAGTCSTRT